MPPFTRPPRKTALSKFTAIVVPDRIEESYERIVEYYEQFHHLGFQDPRDTAAVLDELIGEQGEKARNALYALLCDSREPLYAAARSALEGGVKDALQSLNPQVAAKYGMAPSEALLLVSLAVKALTIHGEAAVCEELAQRHRKAARGARADANKKAREAADRARRKAKQVGLFPAGPRKPPSRKKPA